MDAGKVRRQVDEALLALLRKRFVTARRRAEARRDAVPSDDDDCEIAARTYDGTAFPADAVAGAGTMDNDVTVAGAGTNDDVTPPAAAVAGGGRRRHQ